MAYNSAYTGSQVDAAVGAVRQKETIWDGKQDELTGTEGQLVGFNSAGEATAVAKPTYTAADVGAMPAVSGGTAGQVLTKTEAGQEWQDAPDGLPSGGEEGQVLTKTASGAQWDDVPSDLPAGGTDGQILTKTADGVAWEDAPEGGVTSFNSRTGAVTPQSGDYTADMVGARPNTWTPTASFSVTIPADGWGEDNTATVQDPMFAASGYAYVCGPDEESRSGWASGGVRAADSVTADGSLEFLCDTVPDGALTVNFVRMETGGASSPVLSTGGAGGGGGGGGIKLLSIAITTPPNKTAYRPGEVFDPAGMVVTASYEFGLEQAVTGYTYSPSGALAEENTQITISYTEGGVTAQTTQAITVTTISNTLNSNSWATIKAVSDAGQGDNYWDVGDTKQITINGKVGNTNISNLAINVFIIGFNHNASREGSNRIHFKIGKIGNTQVGLCDSEYGNYTSTSGAFTMNTSNTNSGGWANSHMRKTVLGSDASPTSPRANTLLAALPADLRAVMKPITKYSDNTGGGNNTASYVTSTTDYLPLLSEFEYHGTRTYANSAEQNFQQQYAYYQAGNSKVHYKHNATGTAAGAWCRSVYAAGTGYFCLVGTDGSAGNHYASYSWAVAAGFAA